MSVWKPCPSIGGLLGLTLIAALLALEGLFLSFLLRGPITWLSFGWGLLIVLDLSLVAFLGYRVHSLFGLEYWLDRDALTIVGGGRRRVVPLGDISEVVKGKKRPGDKIGGLRWPGYWMGPGQIEGLGPVSFYATRPPDKQLWVITPTQSYGLSPDDPYGFLKAFELRKRLGPVHELAQGERRTHLMALPIWDDRLAHLLLALGLAVNAALFAYICWRYPTLPRILPFHFNLMGQADRTGARAGIFALPIIGGGVFTLNAVLGLIVHSHRKIDQKLSAHLLWGGTIVVEGLFWLATLAILG
jgi:hypothetical protein